MNKTVDYQGYKIESVPHRLDDEKWRLHIYISVEDSRGVLTRQFAGDSIYAIEQEADIHGIAYGQRLIDGKVDGQFRGAYATWRGSLQGPTSAWSQDQPHDATVCTPFTREPTRRGQRAQSLP